MLNENEATSAMTDPDFINQFKSPSGEIDSVMATAWLAEIQKQAASGPLPPDTLRQAIDVIRMLRRTNTGPARAKKKTGKVAPIEGTPDLLDL